MGSFILGAALGLVFGAIFKTPIVKLIKKIFTKAVASTTETTTF